MVARTRQNQQNMRATICITSRVERTTTRMDVPFIICTRDRSRQLGACLESVRRITFERSWELIIVDNGSVDVIAQLKNLCKSHRPLRDASQTR
jgi:hypothetical protein